MTPVETIARLIPPLALPPKFPACAGDAEFQKALADKAEVRCA